MYDYKARVVRWKDGDTVVLHVDQGFGNYTEQSFRLVGLACPEKSQPGGVEAWKRAQELAPVGSIVYIDSRKPTVQDLWTWKQLGRTFERWLAVVEYRDADGFAVDVAKTLIKEGLATRYGK